MHFLARTTCAGVFLLAGWGPICSVAVGDRSRSLQGIAEAIAEAGSNAARHTVLRGKSELGESMASLIQTRRSMRRLTSRQPEQLEEWQDAHTAVDVDASAIRSSSLLEMSQAIDAKAYSDELHDLCDSYRTRFVGTDGNVDMSNKIKDKFNKLGLQTWVEDLDVTPKVQRYLRGNSTRRLGGNVIGLLEGSDLAHEVVIVGAHYDSVNWENTRGKAPGVDDNGSGSALVQLVARTLAHNKVKPRRSMLFVGFNSEEEGLVGSDQMAKKAQRGDYGDVKAVLIADEVAYPGVGSGRRKAIFETLGTVPGTSSLLDTLAKNAQVAGGDGINGFQVNKKGFGSDHMSFLQLSIPSVLLIERNNMAHADAWGHSERDNWEHVDVDYGAAMTRLMLRTAMALGSPARSGSTPSEGSMTTRMSSVAPIDPPLNISQQL